MELSEEKDLYTNVYYLPEAMQKMTKIYTNHLFG